MEDLVREKIDLVLLIGIICAHKMLVLVTHVFHCHYSQIYP